MSETLHANKTIKPLGGKCYGSICHLPGSRLGPGDHKLHMGQARILTEKVRDRHDIIIVQEKLDGSNVGIANVGGTVVPLGRAGYPAVSSKYEQHRLFAAWVYTNIERFDFLQPGERMCGEWLAQAHGTRYTLTHEPFVVFDIFKGDERLTYQAVADRLHGQFIQAHLIHMGGPLSIESAMTELTGHNIRECRNGFHGAIDPVEGAVWRVERKGAVDFLGKYVRPDKKDGCYLPEISGQAAVWNWRP